MSAQKRPRLSDDRVRSRISAYVYGDVLVLAAVLALEPEGHASWSSVLGVVATMVTTYLAHVVSDAIGSRVGRAEADTAGHLREELRDAAPIAVAGVVPAVAGALAVVHVLPADVAQILSAAFIVLRLAAVGAVTSRLTGRTAPLAAVLSGTGIAVIGAALAVGKAALAH